MTYRKEILCGVAAVALSVALASAAWAEQPQDPATTGQGNDCWGQTASGLAQLDEKASMGRHSMATKAALKHDGFAATNGFGITFNVKEDGDNAGRDGVGNVSKGQPHNTHPGDAGNGAHAENNNTGGDGLNFATILDPVTGDFGGISGGQELVCEDRHDLP